MDGVDLFDRYRLFVTEHATQPVYVVQKVTEDTQAKTKFQTNYFLRVYYPSLFFGSKKKNVRGAQDAVTTDTLRVDKLNALVTVRVNADGIGEAPGVDLTSLIHVACYAQYTNRYHIMCVQKHKVDAQSGLSTKLQHDLAPVLQYDVTTCPFLPKLITVTNAAGHVATVTDLVPWTNNDFVLILREHGSRVSRLFYVASTPNWGAENKNLYFTNKPYSMDSFTMNDVLKIAHHPHYFSDTAISSQFHHHIYTLEASQTGDEFSYDLGVYSIGYDDYKLIRSGECNDGSEIRMADVTGSTQTEKAANCASACLSRGTPFSGYSWSGKEDWVIQGFIIHLTVTACWCETSLGATCSYDNDSWQRYDFTPQKKSDSSSLEKRSVTISLRENSKE